MEKTRHVSYVKTSEKLPRAGHRVIGYMPGYLWPDMQLRIVVRHKNSWEDARTGSSVTTPLCWAYLPMPPASFLEQGKQIQDSMREQSQALKEEQ